MSGTVLASLLEDATALKDSLIGARHTGDLTNGEAERAISGVAVVTKVVKDAIFGTNGPRPLWEGPLPEYMRWPNTHAPCPKCEHMDEGSVHYLPSSKDGPERMRHTCRCGYAVFTKPCDASEGGIHA